jgi:hypothetical protein
VADVEQIDVVERKEIKTPWASRQNGDVVLYRLGPVSHLQRPIELTSGETMAGRWRWTTRLGLQRATNLRETRLETEPEWRLLEWMQANRLVPEIRVDSPSMQTSEDPRGRAWFHLKSGNSIRYDGSNGFLLKRSGMLDRYLTLDKIVHELQRSLKENQ